MLYSLSREHAQEQQNYFITDKMPAKFYAAIAKSIQETKEPKLLTVLIISEVHSNCVGQRPTQNL